jgi:hypothetical protein
MLEAAKKRMSFVTTLNGVMAESPELLAGYNALADTHAAMCSTSCSASE